MNGSLRRTIALSRKEFLHIWKDPRTLLIVFLLPLIQLVLFGYSFTLELQEIPLAVIDHDGSTQSRRLIESFAGSKLFRFVEYDGGISDCESLFKARRARAVMIIPHDFERCLERRMDVDLQFIFDASDPNAATLMKNYCNQVIVDFNAARGHAVPLPFEVRTSILYNPNLKSSLFFVPGIVAMIMVMICALLTSITVAREIETGTMEQMLVSPIRPREIIAGKVLPYILLTFLDGTVILLAGILLFGVPLRGSVPLMVALSTLYLVTALSLGLMISTLARTQQVAMMLAITATVLPTILLSGLVFPIDSMPRLLQYISYLIPAKYYLFIIRGIMLKGSTAVQLWHFIVCLFIMATVLFTVAARRFGMRLER